jgi:hypothetical protein
LWAPQLLNGPDQMEVTVGDVHLRHGPNSSLRRRQQAPVACSSKRFTSKAPSGEFAGETSPTARPLHTNTMLSITDISEIPATERHVGTVIVLHGMGESHEQWYTSCRFASTDDNGSLDNARHRLVIARSLNVRFPHLKFVFPAAPSRRITLVKGPAMSAWFDIVRLFLLIKGPELIIQAVDDQ